MEDLRADVQILGHSLLLLLLFLRCLKPFGIHRIALMVNSVIGYIPVFCLKAQFSEEIQAHVAVTIPSLSSPSLLRFFPQQQASKVLQHFHLMFLSFLGFHIFHYHEVLLLMCEAGLSAQHALSHLM